MKSIKLLIVLLVGLPTFSQTKAFFNADELSALKSKIKVIFGYDQNRVPDRSIEGRLKPSQGVTPLSTEDYYLPSGLGTLTVYTDEKGKETGKNFSISLKVLGFEYPSLSATMNEVGDISYQIILFKKGGGVKRYNLLSSYEGDMLWEKFIRAGGLEEIKNVVKKTAKATIS